MTDAPVVQQLQSFFNRLTPTKWSTPLNLQAHRKELTRRIRDADSSPYTMPIRLPDVNGDLACALGRSVLHRLQEIPERFRALVEVEVVDALTHLRVIQERDDDALNTWTINSYGLPSAEILREADRLLAQPPTHPEDASTMSPDDLAAAMCDALRAYGLDNWTVTIDPNMSANASVQGQTSTVKINQSARPTIDECRRLVAHEVGGHVLRWENARRQPTPWALFGFGNTVPTEEGLAALVEEQLEVATPHTQRRYAERVKAVHASRTRDLLELAFHLSTLMPAAEAADLTLRVRRGISSPKSTGGTTKDHGYLTGLHFGRQLADDDPEGLQLLRGTKWAVEHLPLARDLSADGCLMPALLTATAKDLRL